MARLRTTMLALQVTALAGCGEAVAPTPIDQSVFVGRVAGTDIAIAVVLEESSVAAYLCGGPTTLESTAWLRGDAQGATVNALGERGALSAQIEGDSLRGSVVDAQGIRRAFAIGRATNGAGLFDNRDAACRTGVIVLDADRAEAQGAGCDGAGRRSQVTPIRPWSMGSHGLAAQTTLAPERVIYVRPVHPSLVRP